MIRALKIWLLTFFIISGYLCYAGNNDSTKSNFFAYPKSYELFEYKFLVGIGLTKLPTQVVEEEINTSPMAFIDFRIGLPLSFTSNLYLATNYLSTIGTLGLQLNLLNGRITVAAGANASYWFGNLDIESIKLKSYGFIFRPYVAGGININGVLFSGKFEIQSGQMQTYSDGAFLAKFNQPRSNYSLKIAVEQPFYHSQWVLIGLGLNYATFYYQSWLTYSSIKQYLLYPEFYFGLIL